MRKLRFLVPGTTGKYRCGGLLVEIQTAQLLCGVASVELVTYRQREPGLPFLFDLLRLEPQGYQNDAPLWIVSWGFDVPYLLAQLGNRPTAYHAHSAGYGFDLPVGVPILAVSRNTLGYWGSRAARNPLFLVPNALENKWISSGDRHSIGKRKIDVLVQERKSSKYVLKQLVPALRERGLVVEVQRDWVENLVQLFNSSTVYLYDSAPYWAARGVTEGFGLPPIEALACGCIVFSSFNHALADLMDPGLVGHQLGFGTLKADLDRITAAVNAPEMWKADEERLDHLLEAHSEGVLLNRWIHAINAIDAHWHQFEKDVLPLRSAAFCPAKLSRIKYAILTLVSRLRNWRDFLFLRFKE